MKTFEIDTDRPAEDPGNQLRARLKGQGYIEYPVGFNDLLHTAKERGLLQSHVSADDALLIVRLHSLATSISKMSDPAGELRRLSL